MAVVISDSQGGLLAAAGDDFELVAGTTRQFTSLTTMWFPHPAGAGHVDTDQGGWVALAVRKA